MLVMIKICIGALYSPWTICSISITITHILNVKSKLPLAPAVTGTDWLFLTCVMPSSVVSMKLAVLTVLQTKMWLLLPTIPVTSSAPFHFPHIGSEKLSKAPARPVYLPHWMIFFPKEPMFRSAAPFFTVTSHVYSTIISRNMTPARDAAWA